VQVRLLDEAGNVVHHEQRPLVVGRPASEDADSAAVGSAVADSAAAESASSDAERPTTSGTAGERKMIPVTRSYIKEFRRAS